MTDNKPILKVDHRGFVYYQEVGKLPVRLPLRCLPGGQLEFAVKSTLQRQQYGRRICIKRSDLNKVEPGDS